MRSAEAYRQIVVARAGGACEYCRLLEAATGVTFHVEHVLPRAQGGNTTLANLALSCPGCNQGLREMRMLDRKLSDAFLKVLDWWRERETDQPLYDILAELERDFPRPG